MPTVSDTSPISNLALIRRLNLLNEQFGQVIIPKAVDLELREVPDASARIEIEQALERGWLRIQAASNFPLVGFLLTELDRGEAEAIALAVETKAGLLLIDEREGRILARQAGLRLTGVLGVVLRAKRQGTIQSVKSEIAALRTRARFFIAPDLETSILQTAGEA
jgi:predicted nucleic acid-binding protein